MVMSVFYVITKYNKHYYASIQLKECGLTAFMAFSFKFTNSFFSFG